MHTTLLYFMQDMVPGLAIEEFSTPPSSPVMVTRTRSLRKTAVSTTNSVHYNSTRDSSNDLYNMQLGEYQDNNA